MKYNFSRIGRWGVIALLLVSCNEGAKRIPVETSTPVWLEEVQTRTIEQYITTTGTAKAAQDVELNTLSAGYYSLQTNPRTGQKFKLGDFVKEGTVIVRVESKTNENNISIESKRLKVEIAKKELEGKKTLLEKGGATELDINNAENSYLSSQTALENAEISLEEMSIKAPFDGVITALPYFTPDAKISSGTPVVHLMDYSTMYLETKFPENNMEDLKVGQHVYITNYNIKSDTLKARLTQLSPAIDETTRTFDGFIVIDNKDLKLRPGMFAKAEIVVKRRENVVAIAKNIITTRKEGGIVFTVERSNAEMRQIKTGLSDNDYTEVLSGLEAGEKIVVRGYEWLRNRSKVKVME